MCMYLKVLWFVSIHILYCITEDPSTFYIVNTTLGQIRGVEHSESSNIKTYMFLGVPYAEPPKRFKKPEPLKPWSGVKIAVSLTNKKACNQIIYSSYSESEVGEDCLYCDIYVPWKIDYKKKKAVVIWILGGRFLDGQRKFLPAKKFALNGDVINVVVSYRLGVFGFLSTGDSIIPGNFGLWDQQMAIEWVKTHIDSFSGDPTRITLAGFEAGAVSASLQAVTHHSSGNFQRMLLYSAHLNVQSAILHEAPQYAQRLANYMCPRNSPGEMIFSSQEIYDCLVSKPARDLTYASHAVLGHSEKPLEYPIGPVIDNDFISATTSFKDLYPVDVLISLVQNEHFMFFMEQMTSLETSYIFNKYRNIPRDIMCKEFAPSIVDSFYNNATDPLELADLICNFYTSTDETEQSRNALRLLGDFFHYYPTIDTIENYSSKNNNKSSYLCLFTQKSLFGVLTDSFEWLEGTIDGDDLAYLVSMNLKSLLDPSLSTPETVKTVGILSKYVSNFIKTGNPNSDTSLPYWEQFEPENQHYLNLNASPSTESFLYKDRVDFWRKTVPAFLQSKQTTKATTTTTATTMASTKTTTGFLLLTDRYTKSTRLSTATDRLSVSTYIPPTTASLPTPRELGSANISNGPRMNITILYSFLYIIFYALHTWL